MALDGDEYIDFGRRDQFAMKNDFTVEAWVWIGKVEWSSYVISALGRTTASQAHWLGADRRPQTPGPQE